MQTISEKIYFDKQSVRLRGVDFFDVCAIFECGQAFRFDKVEGSSHAVEYGGVAFGRYISVAQDGDEVIIYGADEGDFYNIWRLPVQALPNQNERALYTKSVFVHMVTAFPAQQKRLIS